MKQFCSLSANGMPSERLGEVFRVIEMRDILITGLTTLDLIFKMENFPNKNENIGLTLLCFLEAVTLVTVICKVRC